MQQQYPAEEKKEGAKERTINFLRIFVCKKKDEIFFNVCAQGLKEEERRQDGNDLVSIS